MRPVSLSLGALCVAAASALAQGAVSNQGFGYPAGGVSTRSAAGGSAFAEFDFASPRNPSSLLGWGRGGIYFEYSPELRTVQSPAGSDHTTTVRFPVMGAAVQIGNRTIASLSATTLLDRTWATRVRGGEILGSDSVGYSEFVQSNGAINDLRFGAAVSVTRAFSVGLGIHALTGENRLLLQRQFDDSLKYGAINRGLVLEYSGAAVSVGATWRPHPTFAIAASARAGGSLDMHVSDSLLASAHVPDRYGAAIRFDGLPGTSLALTAEHTSWSRMSGLSSSSLATRDTWDYGGGIELTGPRMGQLPILLYLGYRARDLPFSMSGEASSERTISTGASLPVSGTRAVFDFALQRAARSKVDAVSEHAWIVSVGLTIRP